MNWEKYEKWLEDNVVFREKTRALEEDGISQEHWVFGSRWSIYPAARAKYSLTSDLWHLGNALGIFINSNSYQNCLPEWEEDKNWEELFPEKSFFELAKEEGKKDWISSRKEAIWADLQKLYDQYWLTEKTRLKAWEQEFEELDNKVGKELEKVIGTFFNQEITTEWQNHYPNLIRDFELLGVENQKYLEAKKEKLTDNQNSFFQENTKKKEIFEEIKQEIKFEELTKTSTALKTSQSTMEGNIAELQAGLEKAQDTEVKLAEEQKRLQTELATAKAETEQKLKEQKLALEQKFAQDCQNIQGNKTGNKFTAFLAGMVGAVVVLGLFFALKKIRTKKNN